MADEVNFQRWFLESKCACIEKKKKDLWSTFGIHSIHIKQNCSIFGFTCPLRGIIGEWPLMRSYSLVFTIPYCIPGDLSARTRADNVWSSIFNYHLGFFTPCHNKHGKSKLFRFVCAFSFPSIALIVAKWVCLMLVKI